MATSGQHRLQIGRSVFELNWQLAEQNIAENYSVVNYQVILRTNGMLYYSNAVKITGGGINGQAIGTGTWSNITSDRQLLSGQFRIHHNGDGTKSFYADIAGWLYGAGSGAGGSWFELPRIPRQSNPTFDKDVYTIGEPITVQMNRKANFTHRGTLQIPDGQDIYSFKNITDNFTWTPDAAKTDEIYRRMANATELSLGVDITTWSGSTQIGSIGWQNKKIRVDAELVRPDFSDFAFRNDDKTRAILGNSTELIQGVSTLTATISTAQKMTTKKYATARNYAVIFDGQTKELAESTSTLTFSNFESFSSGDLLIRAIAKDSRNLTREVSKTVKVHAYSAPQVHIKAERQNNFDATTKVQISGSYTPLSGKNNISNLKYRWREANGSWNSWKTILPAQDDGSFSAPDQYLSLNNASQFEIEVLVTDKVGKTSTATVTVEQGVPILFISSNKQKVGIGKVPEMGALDVKGDIFENGKRVLTEIPEKLAITRKTTNRSINRGKHTIFRLGQSDGLVVGRKYLMTGCLEVNTMARGGQYGLILGGNGSGWSEIYSNAPGGIYHHVINLTYIAEYSGQDLEMQVHNDNNHNVDVVHRTRITISEI